MEIRSFTPQDNARPRANTVDEIDSTYAKRRSLTAIADLLAQKALARQQANNPASPTSSTSKEFLPEIDSAWREFQTGVKDLCFQEELPMTENC